MRVFRLVISFFTCNMFVIVVNVRLAGPSGPA